MDLCYYMTNKFGLKINRLQGCIPYAGNKSEIENQGNSIISKHIDVVQNNSIIWSFYRKLADLI